jgi:hypothetical protein
MLRTNAKPPNQDTAANRPFQIHKRSQFLISNGKSCTTRPSLPTCSVFRHTLSLIPWQDSSRGESEKHIIFRRRTHDSR